MADDFSLQGLAARVRYLEQEVAARVHNLEKEVQMRVGTLEQEVKILKEERQMEESPRETLLGESTRDTQSDTPSESDQGDCDTSSIVGMCTAEGHVTYSMQKSAWDMVILAGLKTFGPAGNTAIVAGVFLNIFIQSCFCYVLMGDDWVSLSDIKEGPVGVERWRLHYGHSFENADPMSGSSLVSRVCGDDNALYQSQAQASVHGAARDYFRMNGPLLSVTVIIVYAMAVCSELRDILGFVAGIWGLPRRETTLLKVQGGSAKLVGISRTRLAFSTLLGISRFLVAAVLFRSGSIWLVKTINIESLLLNCVALSFVLGVDELVFAVFSPFKLANLVDELEPLAFTKGFIFRSILWPVTVFMVTAFCLNFLITDLGTVLQVQSDTLEAMCGGEQNFVVGVDKAGGLFYLLTPAHGAEHLPTQESVFAAREECVRAIMKHNHTADPRGNALWPMTSTFTAKRDFFERMHLSLEKLRGVPCRDNDLDGYAYAATGNVSVKQCDEASDYCDAIPSTAIRIRCAHTCGCDSPSSGLVMRDDCPPSCKDLDHYQKLADELLCKDGTPQELMENPGWSRWFTTQMRKMGRNNESWNSATLAHLNCTGMLTFMEDLHHAYAGDVWHIFRMCEKNLLVSFCPEACGCKEKRIAIALDKLGLGVMTACPGSCVAE